VKAPLLEFKPDTPLVFAAVELKDTRHGFEVVWPKTLDKLSICAAQVGTAHTAASSLRSRVFFCAGFPFREQAWLPELCDRVALRRIRLQTGGYMCMSPQLPWGIVVRTRPVSFPALVCNLSTDLGCTHALSDVARTGIHQARPSCLLCSRSADAPAHGELDV
jgi:hypothetical protein